MVESLEREMELLCLTGVEDQLQADVRPTLELLRNAGIKVRDHTILLCFTTTVNLLYAFILRCPFHVQYVSCEKEAFHVIPESD